MKGLSFTLVLTYGLISWPAWVGLGMTPSQEVIMITLLAMLAGANSLLANRFMVPVLTRAATLFMALLIATSVREAYCVLAYDSSAIVVVYCLLNCLVMGFVLTCGSSLLRVGARVYLVLAIAQVIVLLLAVASFESVSGVPVDNAASAIARKIDLYGYENRFTFRNIGPFYFSSITDLEVFGEYGVLGFGPEPHISFTIMFSLFLMACMGYRSWTSRALMSLLFLPSLLYVSTSNLVALMLALGVLVMVRVAARLGVNTMVRASAMVTLLYLGTALLAKLWSLGSLALLIPDRSIAESVSNTVRLLSPVLSGSGLTDVFDRNNSMPAPMGVISVLMYLAYATTIWQAILTMTQEHQKFMAFLLCYLFAYSFKSPTVFIYSPLLCFVMLTGLNVHRRVCLSSPLRVGEPASVPV